MKNRFKNGEYIQYSNVFEDVNTLLELIPNNAKNVLSIASSGDNALALLTKDITSLVIIDKNIIQLNLAKLKAKAFLLLEYEELLTLFGVKDGDSLAIYYKIRDSLDEETRKYFDDREALIEKIKIIHAGRFEYYFQRFKKLLPFVVAKKRVNEFMNLDTTDEQTTYFYKHIYNKRFKMFAKKFFSAKVVAKLGREEDYFLYAKDDLAMHIIKRFVTCISNTLNKENPYLQYVVFNKFYELPFYLKKENFCKIKENIHKITFMNIDLKDIGSLNMKFDFYNLSDVFEYLSADETDKIATILYDMTEIEGIIVFWNMLVRRVFSDTLFQTIDGKNLLVKEHAYFYQALRIYKKE